MVARTKTIAYPLLFTADSKQRLRNNRSGFQLTRNPRGRHMRNGEEIVGAAPEAEIMLKACSGITCTNQQSFVRC